MDIKILHFYPDLMSLYGSYANVSVPVSYTHLTLPTRIEV